MLRERQQKVGQKAGTNQQTGQEKSTKKHRLRQASSPPDLKGHLQLIQEITWHSCRVTLLSAAVQAQVPDKEIGLQANWKNPSQLVHWWLGARFDQQKLQLCSDATILGVTYDLEQHLIKIKKSRKKELFDEISLILEHEELSPGQAGKLRGKLMFGASQLWGKVERAFLRALSDRQYSRRTTDTSLTPALLYSLYKWRALVMHGPPRPIPGSGSRKSDVVIFTDGSAPSSSPKDPATEMIGGVMFTREDSPKQFSSDVPKPIVQRWFPRKTQICMIELLAAVVAVQTFREEIRGKLVLLFIDSEPVEAALIKGYSAKEDVCELVGLFWDLVLELRCSVYIDRVPTDSNPADNPSRGDVATGLLCGWITIPSDTPKGV